MTIATPPVIQIKARIMRLQARNMVSAFACITRVQFSLLSSTTLPLLPIPHYCRGRRPPPSGDGILDHGSARRHAGHIVGGSHRSAIDPGTDASSPVTGDAGSYRICLWPVRAASVIMSSIRCRVTAVSKLGCIELPFRIASLNFA